MPSWNGWVSCSGSPGKSSWNHPRPHKPFLLQDPGWWYAPHCRTPSRPTQASFMHSQVQLGICIKPNCLCGHVCLSTGKTVFTDCCRREGWMLFDEAHSAPLNYYKFTVISHLNNLELPFLSMRPLEKWVSTSSPILSSKDFVSIVHNLPHIYILPN